MVGLTAFVPMVLMTLPAGHVADTRERKSVIDCHACAGMQRRSAWP